MFWFLMILSIVFVFSPGFSAVWEPSKRPRPTNEGWKHLHWDALVHLGWGVWWLGTPVVLLMRGLEFLGHILVAFAERVDPWPGYETVECTDCGTEHSCPSDEGGGAE